MPPTSPVRAGGAPGTGWGKATVTRSTSTATSARAASAARTPTTSDVPRPGSSRVRAGFGEDSDPKGPAWTSS
jgi:hypothetical protein